MALISGAMLATGLVLIGGLTALLRRATRRQELDRNGAFGLRTAATRASDAAWQAGHAAAARHLALATVVSLAGALAILSVGAWVWGTGDARIEWVLLVAVVAYGATVGTLLTAVVIADRAARAITSE